MISAGAFGAGLAAAGIGALVAVAVAGPRLRKPPSALVRTNYRGRAVPAVLGEAVAMGSLVSLGAMALFGAAGWEDAPGTRVSIAAGLLVVMMFAAGSWDDHRGDERPRGFKGHLGALKTGVITGGLVKLIAGGLAGLSAGAVLGAGLIGSIEVGLLVALTANLINLLDRAPGRSAKFFLAVALPVTLLAPDQWAGIAGGASGALGAVLASDLREKGMLGDSGANPLGAILGLGLAIALPQWGRWLAIGLLLGLNAASERWSFSKVIANTPVLRAFDEFGRPRHSAGEENAS